MSSLAELDHAPSTANEIKTAPPTSSPTIGLGFFVGLIEYGMRSWRRRSLKRAFAAAQLALGERMLTSGIDDGELGGRIKLLDDKIRRAAELSASTETLRAERTQLLMRLATAALEDEAPLPGADDEYNNARRAETALRKCEEALNGYHAASA